MAKGQDNGDEKAAQALLDAVLHENPDGAEIVGVDGDGMVHIQTSGFVMRVLQTAFSNLDTLRKGIYYAVKSILPTGTAAGAPLEDDVDGELEDAAAGVALEDDADGELEDAAAGVALEDDADGELEDAAAGVALEDDADGELEDAVAVYEDPLAQYVRDLDTDSMVEEARGDLVSRALTRILTPQVMEELGLDKLDAVAGSHLLYSTTAASQSNVGVLMAQGRAEAFAQVLSHPDAVASIIRGDDAPIASLKEIDALGDAASSPLSGNVLAVDVDGRSVTTTFNFAAFLQLMNSHLDSDSALKSPILAQLVGVEREAYTMHLDTFRRMMGEAAEVIFNPEEYGLRPIMTGGVSDEHDVSLGLLEQKSLFAVTIDRSGSMAGSKLQVCKHKMKEALRKLTDSAENWTVILTQFSDEAEGKEFDSSEHSIQDIEGYINSITAEGYTRLNLTSKEMYESLADKVDEYSNVVTIIFTDGCDGGLGIETCDESKIIEVAESARETVNNLRIVTAEIGGHNSKFFNIFARQIGADHIDLNSMEGLGVISDMANELSTESSVVRFLAAAYDEYVRMVGAHGRVVVSEHLMPSDATGVTINGNPYYMHSPEVSLAGMVSPDGDGDGDAV